MSKFPDEVRSEGKRIAAKLGETEGQPKFIIMRLVNAYGVPWVEELADLAIAIQAAGGQLQLDGVTPRTLGGIFFRLVKDKLTIPTWQRVIPWPARVRRNRPPKQQEVTARAS